MNAARYLPFVGRLLIGLRFVMSDLGKLAAYGPTTAMIVPRSHERNAAGA
jgi:putative oxidoreductase